MRLVTFTYMPVVMGQVLGHVPALVRLYTAAACMPGKRWQCLQACWGAAIGLHAC